MSSANWSSSWTTTDNSNVPFRRFVWLLALQSTNPQWCYYCFLLHVMVSHFQEILPFFPMATRCTNLNNLSQSVDPLSYPLVSSRWAKVKWTITACLSWPEKWPDFCRILMSLMSLFQRLWFDTKIRSTFSTILWRYMGVDWGK